MGRKINFYDNSTKISRTPPSKADPTQRNIIEILGWKHILQPFCCPLLSNLLVIFSWTGWPWWVTRRSFGSNTLLLFDFSKPKREHENIANALEKFFLSPFDAFHCTTEVIWHVFGFETCFFFWMTGLLNLTVFSTALPTRR